MEYEGLEEGQDVTSSILVFSVILCVILLAVVLVINGMSTANDSINGRIIVGGQADNESGYLNDTGYTLLQGSQSWAIVEVIAVETNTTIDPSNYTLVDDTIYNVSEVSC